MNPILVIGATGTVGRQVVSRLAATGMQVRAMARNPGAAQPRELFSVLLKVARNGQHIGFDHRVAYPPESPLSWLAGSSRSFWSDAAPSEAAYFSPSRSALVSKYLVRAGAAQTSRRSLR